MYVVVQQWLCEERLVEQLVDKFVKADEDPDMQECIAQTFQDLVLVSTSMFSALQTTPEIVARLESEYVVNTLFVHILQSVCDLSFPFFRVAVGSARGFCALPLHPSVILSKHRCFLAVDNSYGRKQQPRFKYTWSHSILSELAISKREYPSFCCCIIHPTRVLVIFVSYKVLQIKVETTTIR